MSDVVIRDARLRDYSFLCTSFRDVNGDHCKMRPDYYRKVDPIISKKDFLKAWLAQQFKAGKKLVCVKIAEQDDEKLGAVFALSVERRALGWSQFPKEACIDNIVVFPDDKRRQGIGTALLDAAEVWAKQTGHEYIYEKIVSKNHKSRAFFADAGHKETDVIMGKHLG